MAEQEGVPMREEFPRWYRPVGIGDNRERLALRWKGVVALVDNAHGKSIETMIAIALRTKPQPQQAEVTSLRRTVKKADDLFEMEGNDRELEILCGSALATLFENDGDLAAHAALAMTTASLCGTRVADFPLDLARAAETALARISDARRTRPDLAKMTIARPPSVGLDQERLAVLRQTPIGENVADAVMTLSKQSNEALLRLAQDVSTALKAANDFLEIQDEELQMLWWLFGSRSTKMDRPFTDLSPDGQPFVLAVELADMTRFPPGPVSLKPILGRAGLKERRKCSVSTAVNACEAEFLRPLVAAVEPSKITQPLHFAIKLKLETGDDTAWIAAWSQITGIDAGLPLPGIELGNLLYRERLSVLFGGE